MESLNIFPNYNLDKIVRNLIFKTDNVKGFLNLIRENPNWVDENTDGQVEAQTLIQLIDNSYNSAQFAELLRHLIDSVEGALIDDTIFNKLFNHPDTEVREFLHISLSHKKLSESQLLRLCNNGVAFECYYELAILYYEEKSYNVQQLETFFSEFYSCRYAYLIEDLIAELVGLHTASSAEKRDYVYSIYTNN